MGHLVIVAFSVEFGFFISLGRTFGIFIIKVVIDDKGILENKISFNIDYNTLIFFDKF